MHDHQEVAVAEPARWTRRARRRARSAVQLALSVTLGAAIVSLGPAAAIADPPAEITCGTVLTTSVTLHEDLDCTGDALIIGANGITVNLAGHSITGAGTGSGILADLHDDLTVHSGTIAGFATDVNLSQVRNATFTALAIQDGQGVRLFLTEDVRFRSTNLTDSQAFIQHGQRTSFDSLVARHSNFFLSEAVDVTIASSSLDDTVVHGFESDRVSVVNSRLDNSPIDYGVTSRDWLIQNNTMRSAGEGVHIGPTAPRSRIIGNTFIGNGIGVLVDPNFLDEADGTVISDNTFIDNAVAGVLVDFFQGVLHSPTMTISRNRFLRNGFQPNGRTDHLGRPVADGAHITAAPGSMITVADNLANHNAAYGNFADPGSVIDGGGNKSIGDPLGCLGVVCQPEV